MLWVMGSFMLEKNSDSRHWGWTAKWSEVPSLSSESGYWFKDQVTE